MPLELARLQPAAGGRQRVAQGAERAGAQRTRARKPWVS